jgi:hypothetical protein
MRPLFLIRWRAVTLVFELVNGRTRSAHAHRLEFSDHDDTGHRGPFRRGQRLQEHPLVQMALTKINVCGLSEGTQAPGLVLGIGSLLFTVIMWRMPNNLHYCLIGIKAGRVAVG